MAKGRLWPSGRQFDNPALECEHNESLSLLVKRFYARTVCQLATSFSRWCPASLMVRQHTMSSSRLP